MQVCMYVRMYIYVRCKYVCMYLCMDLCMYCMHVRMNLDNMTNLRLSLLL